MDFQEFDEIIDYFRKPYVLNKYGKKNFIILKKFISELKGKNKEVSNLLEIENKEWKREYSIDRFYGTLEKYIDIEEKSNQKFGIGNAVAVLTGDPYLNLELIIKAILSNCNIMFIANPTLVNFNLYVISIMQDILQEENLDQRLISIVNEIDYKTKITKNKDVIDCIIVNKYYEEYAYFAKNTSSKVIYLDYGNINIYTDSEEYEENIDNIVSEVYKIDIDVYDYKINNIEEFLKKEKNNFIFNTAVIFSKDIKKCMRFYEAIKARNVFINDFDITKIDIGLEIEELEFNKNLIIKK